MKKILAYFFAALIFFVTFLYQDKKVNKEVRITKRLRSCFSCLPEIYYMV